MRMTVVMVMVVSILVSMGIGTRIMVMSGAGVIEMTMMIILAVVTMIVMVFTMVHGTMRMVVLILYREGLWFVFMLIGHETARWTWNCTVQRTMFVV